MGGCVHSSDTITPLECQHEWRRKKPCTHARTHFVFAYSRLPYWVFVCYIYSRTYFEDTFYLSNMIFQPKNKYFSQKRLQNGSWRWEKNKRDKKIRSGSRLSVKQNAIFVHRKWFRISKNCALKLRNKSFERIFYVHFFSRSSRSPSCFYHFFCLLQWR